MPDYSSLTIPTHSDNRTGSGLAPSMPALRRHTPEVKPGVSHVLEVRHEGGLERSEVRYLHRCRGSIIRRKRFLHRYPPRHARFTSSLPFRRGVVAEPNSNTSGESWRTWTRIIVRLPCSTDLGRASLAPPSIFGPPGIRGHPKTAPS